MTSSRASHSARLAAATPAALALPHQAETPADPSTAQLDPTLQQGTDAPPPGMPLRDWIKQRKKTAAAAGTSAFPSVQVYCPHGSHDPTTDSLQANAAAQSPSAVEEQQYSSHGDPSSVAACGDAQEAIGAIQTAAAAAASQAPAR